MSNAGSSLKSDLKLRFSANLKFIVDSAGLTRTEFANRLGDRLGKRPSVSGWFRAVAIPSAEILVAIADELNVPLDALFGRYPPSAKPLIETLKHLESLVSSVHGVLRTPRTEEEILAFKNELETKKEERKKP